MATPRAAYDHPMSSGPIDPAQLGRELLELAIVAVGLGVLGAQRAQVQRRELERRLTPVLERLRSCAAAPTHP